MLIRKSVSPHGFRGGGGSETRPRGERGWKTGTDGIPITGLRKGGRGNNLIGPFNPNRHNMDHVDMGDRFVECLPQSLDFEPEGQEQQNQEQHTSHKRTKSHLTLMSSLPILRFKEKGNQPSKRPGLRSSVSFPNMLLPRAKVPRLSLKSVFSGLARRRKSSDSNISLTQAEDQESELNSRKPFDQDTLIGEHSRLCDWEFVKPQLPSCSQSQPLYNCLPGACSPSTSSESSETDSSANSSSTEAINIDTIASSTNNPITISSACEHADIQIDSNDSSPLYTRCVTNTSETSLDFHSHSPSLMHYPQTQSSAYVEADIQYISTGTLDPPVLGAPAPHLPLSDYSETSMSVVKEKDMTPKPVEVKELISESAIVCSGSTLAARVLQIPEILHQILEYVDMNTIPQERLQKRRRPMSLRHALLIYGDPAAAKSAYHESNGHQGPPGGLRSSSTSNVRAGALDDNHDIHVPVPTLLACMQVNSVWYQVVSDVLFQRLHFKGNCAWEKFAVGILEKNEGKTLTQLRSKPSVLVLHKCALATQPQIKTLSKLGGRLRWLEFYTCPLIVPTIELVSGGQLRKLVVPGCTNLTDKALNALTQRTPLLEHLDLRACDMISDAGIRAVARNCPNLRMLNVGRTQRGHLITSSSIRHIAKKTKIETLGLAGCHVDDRAMWALAMYRGPYLQRLSLNNCPMLTNESVPKILAYTRNLTVLELRGCVQITDVRPIVQFKRFRELQGHPPLIEGCEVFDLRLKETEWIMEIEISRQVATDCMEWIHSPDADVNTATD